MSLFWKFFFIILLYIKSQIGLIFFMFVNLQNKFYFLFQFIYFEYNHFFIILKKNLIYLFAFLIHYLTVNIIIFKLLHHNFFFRIGKKYNGKYKKFMWSHGEFASTTACFYIKWLKLGKINSI